MKHYNYATGQKTFSCKTIVTVHIMNIQKRTQKKMQRKKIKKSLRVYIYIQYIKYTVYRMYITKTRNELQGTKKLKNQK